MPTPEEIAAAKAAEDAAAAATEAAKPKYLTIDDFDAKLKERDTALLGALNEIVKSVRPQEQQQQQHQPAKVEEAAITQEEYLNDPAKAMEKFFNTKVAPVLANREQPVDLDARVRLELMQLQNRVKPEEWANYQQAFMQVLQKTDPRVLATPGGMDATWRLTRSYADDMKKEDEQRADAEVKRKAQLETGGKPPVGGSMPVQLDDDEKAMAERLGLSPEDYKKYGTAQEVEIGGKKK